MEAIAAQLFWVKLGVFISLGVAILALATLLYSRKDKDEDKFEKMEERLEGKDKELKDSFEKSFEKLDHKIDSLVKSISAQSKEMLDLATYRVDKKELWDAVDRHRDSGCPLVKSLQVNLRSHIDSHKE